MSHDPLDADADPFRPPTISTVVSCLHCGEVFDSYRIEWRIETDSTGQKQGFWCCPIENCGGRGFGFDIFPTDPDYRDEHGNKMWVDDDEEALDFSDDESAASDSHNGSDHTEPKDDESMPW